MAQFQLLATTTLHDLQPVAVGGRPIYELYNQIVAKLREALGPDHASLFGEPSYNVDTGSIDWFTGLQGKVVLLSDLPAGQDQTSRVQPILHLVREIAEYADQLESSSGAEARLQAQMIRGALVVPAPEDIFLVSGKPVLTNWGLKRVGEEAGPTDLIELLRRVIRAAPATSSPPPSVPQGTATAVPGGTSEEQDGAFTTRFVTSPQAPARETRHRWLIWPLWGIFALSLFAVGWLLLQNCAIGTPHGLGILDRIFVTYCTGVQASLDPPSRPANNETAALHAQLSELERRYFQAVQACTRDCDPPPARTEIAPPPPERPPVDTELCRRLRDVDRPIGAANLVLEWSTADDLDLHVYCPGGTKIFWKALDACGANLQQDVNASDGAQSSTPIEDVRFSSRSPPGEYRVYVHRFKRRSGAPAGTPFKLTLLANGSPVKSETGTAPDGVDFDSPSGVVMTFTLPLQQPSSSAPLPPECASVPERPTAR